MEHRDRVVPAALGPGALEVSLRAHRGVVGNGSRRRHAERSEAGERGVLLAVVEHLQLQDTAAVVREHRDLGQLEFAAVARADPGRVRDGSARRDTQVVEPQAGARPVQELPRCAGTR